jgi:hypothetical protein
MHADIVTFIQLSGIEIHKGLFHFGRTLFQLFTFPVALYHRVVVINEWSANGVIHFLV